MKFRSIALLMGLALGGEGTPVHAEVMEIAGVWKIVSSEMSGVSHSTAPELSYSMIRPNGELLHLSFDDLETWSPDWEMEVRKEEDGRYQVYSTDGESPEMKPQNFWLKREGDRLFGEHVIQFEAEIFGILKIVYELTTEAQMATDLAPVKAGLLLNLSRLQGSWKLVEKQEFESDVLLGTLPSEQIPAHSGDPWDPICAKDLTFGSDLSVKANGETFRGSYRVSIVDPFFIDITAADDQAGADLELEYDLSVRFNGENELWIGSSDDDNRRTVWVYRRK